MNLSSSTTETNGAFGVRPPAVRPSKCRRAHFYTFDGFICAVPSGPKTIMPSEWLRWVWDQEEAIVFREHPADDVFVDIDAKGVRNLLCDAGTANGGGAAFELDDRVDEFLRWSFRAGVPMTS